MPDNRRRKWERISPGSASTKILCVLEGDLASAADALTAPATQNASVLTKGSSGTMEDSGDDILVVNRFEHINLSRWTLILVERINGEWLVVGMDCEPLANWPLP